MKNKEQWFQLFLGQAHTLILYASLVCRIGHGIKSKPPVRTGSIKLNLFRAINLYPFSRKKSMHSREWLSLPHKQQLLKLLLLKNE